MSHPRSRRTSPAAPAAALVAAVFSLFATASPASATIVFESQATAQNGAASTLTIAKPASVANGDVLLAFVTFEKGSDAGNDALLTPAGWVMHLRTNNLTDLGQAFYYRIIFDADAEPASYTWTFDETVKAAGGISRYSGVSNSSPIVESSGNTGDGTTLLATSVLGEAGSVLVAAFGVKKTTALATPGGMTARMTATNPQDVTLHAADVAVGVGATGDRGSTAGSGDKWVAQLATLRSGGGSQLTITPDPLAFGDVVINTTSDVETVTLENTGNLGLSITAIEATAAPFAAAAGGTCPSVPIDLDPDESCTLAYNFSPTMVGNAADTLVVTSDADFGATDFELTGRGVLFLTPPEVTGVGTVARYSGGRAAVTQLFVIFDREMAASAGQAGSYQLIAGGVDGVVETATCATPAGDDVELAIDAASYDGAADTAHLRVNGEVPLFFDAYALLACAADLEDELGDNLDGDGDGIGGDDHVAPFVVNVDHLLEVNPNFDADVAGWGLSTPSAGGLTWSPSTDVGQVPTSGALEMTGDSLPADGPWSATQCVLAAPLEPSFHLRAAVRVDGVVDASANAQLFASGDCTGTPLQTLTTATVASGDGTTWIDLGASPPRRPTSAGAVSARVTVQAVPGASASGSWSVLWDEVAFWGATIFADGLETGDTNQWSAATP